MLLFICCLLCAELTAQSAGLQWIQDIVAYVEEETDWCDRCEWVNPSITEVHINDSKYIFLRYSCSIKQGFARMYDLDGNIISECVNTDGETECVFAFNAFSVFTLAEQIIPIWDCRRGYECDFAKAYGLENRVYLDVDESQCADGIKRLSVIDEYTSYRWLRDDEEIMTGMPEISVDIGGQYAVELTDDNGCMLTADIEIPDINELIVDIKGPTFVCPEEEFVLSTGVYDSYSWSTGDDSLMITSRETGDFDLMVQSADGCAGFASFSVRTYDLPRVDMNISPALPVEGDRVTVDIGESPDIEMIRWIANASIDCDTCTLMSYQPRSSEILTLRLIDVNGCTSTYETEIVLEEIALESYAPNAIRYGSPENGRFTIFGQQNLELIERLSIYDRWGGEVYEATGIPPNQVEIGWDGQLNGQLLNPGVYVYRAVLLYRNGEKKTISGDVLLIH